MDTLRSIALFIAAAVAEIGGAWLVWQGVRENRGWLWVGGFPQGAAQADELDLPRGGWSVAEQADVGGGESLRMRICTRCLKSGRVKRAV